jgi:hypothetical protein
MPFTGHKCHLSSVQSVHDPYQDYECRSCPQIKTRRTLQLLAVLHSPSSMALPAAVQPLRFLCIVLHCCYWQVPGIQARFLALTVHNNINPLNEWSAAPERIRRECVAAYQRYMLKLPVQDTAGGGSREWHGRQAAAGGGTSGAFHARAPPPPSPRAGAGRRHEPSRCVRRAHSTNSLLVAVGAWPLRLTDGLLPYRKAEHSSGWQPPNSPSPPLRAGQVDQAAELYIFTMVCRYFAGVPPPTKHDGAQRPAF